jgi:hypothetical protein
MALWFISWASELLENSIQSPRKPAKRPRIEYRALKNDYFREKKSKECVIL